MRCRRKLLMSLAALFGRCLFLMALMALCCGSLFLMLPPMSRSDLLGVTIQPRLRDLFVMLPNPGGFRSRGMVLLMLLPSNLVRWARSGTERLFPIGVVGCCDRQMRRRVIFPILGCAPREIASVFGITHEILTYPACLSTLQNNLCPAILLRCDGHFRSHIAQFDAMLRRAGTDAQADSIALYPGLSLHGRGNDRWSGGIRDQKTASVSENVRCCEVVQRKNLF